MFSRSNRSPIAIWWWQTDHLLLGMLAVLSIGGLISVMAASPPVAERIGFDEMHFILRHGVFLALALGVLVWTSTLSPRGVRVFALAGFAISLVLVGLSVLIAPEIKGATRWLPLGLFNIQPSEFAKPFFIVATAWLLGLWRDKKYFPGRAISIFTLIAFAGCLILQPDMGMTALVVLTWGFQLFIAGMPIVIVALLALLVGATASIAYFALPHVQSRVMIYLDGGSMQAKSAMRSFANGGLGGTGPGNGEVKYNLPDAHADFIFAVQGEEFGAIFCLVIIALYAIVVLRGFYCAMNTESLFFTLAIAGLALQFGVQAAIHMASSVHLMPTKGMTLPLMSYGGSSLLATGIAMGMLLALARHANANQGRGS